MSHFDIRAAVPDVAMVPRTSPRRSFAVVLCMVKAITYVIALVLLWELAVRMLDLPAYLVPSPQRVLRSFYELPSYYARHALVTLQESLLGLLIGFAGGLILGVVLHYAGWFGRIINPLVVASQVFPKEAFTCLVMPNWSNMGVPF